MSEFGAYLLSQSPPFSKSKVNAEGSKWRDQKEYDSEIIDEFLAFNAELLDEFMRIANDTVASIIRPLSSVAVSYTHLTLPTKA